jgi:hypothetical protein
MADEDRKASGVRVSDNMDASSSSPPHQFPIAPNVFLFHILLPPFPTQAAVRAIDFFAARVRDVISRARAGTAGEAVVTFYASPEGVRLGQAVASAAAAETVSAQDFRFLKDYLEQMSAEERRLVAEADDAAQASDAAPPSRSRTARSSMPLGGDQPLPPGSSPPSVDRAPQPSLSSTISLEELVASVAAEETAKAMPYLQPLEDHNLPAAEIYYGMTANPVVELPAYSGTATLSERIRMLQDTLRRVGAIVADKNVELGIRGVGEQMQEVEELARLFERVHIVGIRADRMVMSRAYLTRVWALSAVRSAVEHEMRDAVFLLLGFFPSPLSSTGATVPLVVADHLARRPTVSSRIAGEVDDDAALRDTRTEAAAAAAGSRTRPRSGVVVGGGAGAVALQPAAEADAVCPSCARLLINTLDVLSDEGVLHPRLLHAGLDRKGGAEDSLHFEAVRQLLVGMRAAQRAFALAGRDWPGVAWPGCARCRGGQTGAR